VTNADIVRSVYERWAKGENGAELFASDIEWSMPHPGGQVKGRDQVVAFLRSFIGAWEAYEMNVEELRELDDGRVLVLFSERARGRSSGVETEEHPAALWTLRDGRVARFEAFGDRGEARRRAGVEPA
jgi:ketosteroid isomerase-like protein